MKLIRTSEHSKYGLLIGLVMIFIISVLWEYSYIGNFSDSTKVQNNILSFSYLEDKEGKFTINDVVDDEMKGKFIESQKANLTKGQSNSVWWVHLTVKDIPLILTITNPTVEKVEIHFIDKTSGQKKVLKSGWAYSLGESDDGFIYPALQIYTNSDIYIRIFSSYIQSYQFKFLTYEEYQAIKTKTLTVISIFTGMLFAVALVHLLQYIKIKEPTQLYFVLHILMMIFYQLSLLGTYRIFSDNLGDILVSKVDVFGSFSIASTALFANAFLKDTIQRKSSKMVLNITLVITALILIISLIGNKQAGNTVSTSLAIFTGISLWILSIKAARHNYSNIKYFVTAYSILVFGLCIFSLRLLGILPNNEWTLLALLVTHTIETILFSLSVAEYLDNYRKMAEKSELAFLKAQIKPHFLYNTLNVLAAIAIYDKNKTRELLLDFAEYLRYSYDFKNQDNHISLEDELKAIKAYVRIQQARFPDMIEIEYDLCPMESIKIPQFIIQPLVENAIQHGLRKMLKPGKVIIRIRNIVNGYEITVEDNGVGMTGEQISAVNQGYIQSESGVGIMNIKKRLQAMYNTDLKIKSGPDEGTVFTFVIPG